MITFFISMFEGKHLIQGIGAGIIPHILDIDLLDEVIQVAFKN